jgi:serine protease Do
MALSLRDPGGADTDEGHPPASPDFDDGVQICTVDGVSLQASRPHSVVEPLPVRAVPGFRQVQIGVEPGDVLLAINGQPLQGVEQIRQVLRRHPRQVALLVARAGERIFVPVALG